MYKWLLSVTIGCLLLTGCSAGPDQPLREQSRADAGRDTLDEELAAAQPTDEAPALGRAAKRAQAKRQPAAQPTPRPDGTPQALAAPAATPGPPAQPAPTASPGKPKSAATQAQSLAKQPQPDKSKKPSLPVHRSHNQAQAGGFQRKLSLAELVRKYPDIFKVSGPAREKKIALTFDDGPDDRFTPQVLDALRENGVKATFFVLGSQANERPALIRRMVREGHVVGNHSYSHANLPKLSVDKFQSQIENTEAVLRQLTGYAPRLIRPPYGAINEEQVQWVSEHHYLIVNWNVDSLDWKSLKADQVLSNILRQTKPGSIILQHSGGASTQDLSGTVQALGPLISKLKSAGYTFVTVPELLQVPKSR